jgi:hypothetical protein
MGIYTIDLVHKDLAFEVNGPFHYIHDPLFNANPNFSIEKQKNMFDFNSEFF